VYSLRTLRRQRMGRSVINYSNSERTERKKMYFCFKQKNFHLHRRNVRARARRFEFKIDCRRRHQLGHNYFQRIPQLYSTGTICTMIKRYSNLPFRLLLLLLSIYVIIFRVWIYYYFVPTDVVTVHQTDKEETTPCPTPSPLPPPSPVPAV
jgi:hypothetical protein